MKGLLSTARKYNKIEMDGVYDWTARQTVNNVAVELPTQKIEINKPKEEKMEHVKYKKEEAINEALNSFQVNGVLLKNVQSSNQNGVKKDTFKETTKSLNKSGQIANKNPNSILGNVGL